MTRALLASVLALALGLLSPTVAEPRGSHSSSGGQRSAKSGSSKPVHVKEYTKKDGTKTEAHDRKAPESRAERAHLSLAELAQARAARRAIAQPVPSRARVGTPGPIHIVTDPNTGRKTITNAIAPSVAARPRPTSPPSLIHPSSPTRRIAPSIAVARDQRGRIQRSAAARHAFARLTGYPRGRPGYVIDHIKPLACGGVDAASNMQWQTIAQAKAKDKVERIGCR